MPPGSPSSPASAPGSGARLGALDTRDIARAARVLWVRSRRQATSLLVGGYRSAFRGGGAEFEESRPYVPGDDVRWIDWNATARTGDPWVKRFREERSQTVLIALDVSASMGFASAGRSKVESASWAAALLAAAAGHAGDRIGLVCFGDEVRAEVAPGQGEAHTWRVIRTAAEAASGCRGRTRLGAAVEWLSAAARRRAVVVLLSDFRDPMFDPDLAAKSRGPKRTRQLSRSSRSSPLSQLGVRHDVVAGIIEDPRERVLRPGGGLRVRDPENPDRLLLLGTRVRRRARYAAAGEVRRRALERRLRRDGTDFFWLSTRMEPLAALTRFFQARGSRRPLAFRSPA